MVEERKNEPDDDKKPEKESDLKKFLKTKFEMASVDSNQSKIQQEDSCL